MQSLRHEEFAGDRELVVNWDKIFGGLPGQDVIIRSISRNFLEEVDDSMVKCKECCAEKDWMKLSEVVHKLKGAVGVFKVLETKDSLAALEQMLPSKNCQKIRPVLDDFLHHLDRLVKYLKTID